MYVSSMYDEIKCLTCGVYQKRSEGEANPAQKLMLFSLLFMLQDFSSCVSTKVFAYCFVVMHLYSSTLWWWWWRKWTGTWGNLQHHSQLQTLLFYKKHLLRFTLARFLVETFQNQNGKWATEKFHLADQKLVSIYGIPLVNFCHFFSVLRHRYLVMLLSLISPKIKVD